MSTGVLLGLYGAGLLTFASPCVLPLLPVYVALLGGASATGSEGTRTLRLRLAGVGFALGLSLVFVALGMATSAAAQVLVAHRRALQIAAGVAMITFGLVVVGVLRLRVLQGDARPLLDRLPTPGGFFGGLLFGAAFGVGWTPCVGPVLGGALTYAAASSTNAWAAGGKLAVYAAGLATPLVVAAFSAPRVLSSVKRLRALTPVVQRATGVMLLAVGALVALDRLAVITPTSTSTPVVTADCAGSGGAAACTLPVVEGAPADAGITGKPQVVEFVSSRCAVCARMTPRVEEVARRCGAGDSLVRVSVDDERGRALADRYAVRALPTFVIVDAAGNEVERAIGEQTIEELSRIVAEVRGESCRVL